MLDTSDPLPCRDDRPCTGLKTGIYNAINAGIACIVDAGFLGRRGDHLDVIRCLKQALFASMKMVGVFITGCGDLGSLSHVDISGVASIIGALGIGSFVGQYLIGSQQRRQVRSEVLRHLSQTESARWASPGTSDPASFSESLRELETAALIARVPRKAVAHYKLFAYAARQLSEENVEDDPLSEYAGGINGYFADLVRASASEVSRLIWSPWLGRIGMGRRLKDQRRQAEQVENSAINRAAEHLGNY